MKLHASAVALSLYSSNVSNITRWGICWTDRMKIKCVLCYFIPHIGSVCTHITIRTTWLISLGGEQNHLWVQKTSTQQQREETILRHSKHWRGINSPPPQCYIYAHSLSSLLNQILTWAPMQIPHFKLFSLRKYFFYSVTHLTPHSLTRKYNSLQCYRGGDYHVGPPEYHILGQFFT